MRRLACLVPILALTFPVAAADNVPTEVGQCVKTTISEITTRVGPGSGDVVGYANGIYGVGYDEVPELQASRIGDRVKLCLTELPQGCPEGDDHGKVYAAYNPRTGGKWEMADAAHMCGGA